MKTKILKIKGSWLEKPNGIFTVQNPWGYRFNINHPKVKLLYERFKKWKGISGAPSDKQRREFEEYLIQHMNKKRGTQDENRETVGYADPHS